MAGKKNKMGALQLTILTAVNMMGSGIIMLPTKLASVGTISILSWIITAGGSMCLAYALAKCGMFSKKSGGMGGYAEYAFGKAGNFLANYAYSISMIFANVGIAITAVGYAAEFFQADLSPLMVAIWTIAILWLTTILNFGGARITGRIGSFTVLGVIIPVLGLSLFGWFWFSGSQYLAAWNPHDLPLGTAVGTSISLTLWSFMGLESACANTDAVENPEKNVPIAVLGGTLGAGLIYILSTNVMAGIVPNAQLAASTAPFGLTFALLFGDGTGKLVMGMMIISCMGSMLGWQFTIAQVFRSSAEQGYFPAIFKKVTRANVPLYGMLILTSLQSLMALSTISPSLLEQFNILVNLAVVMNIIPYQMSMASVDILQRTAGKPSRKNTGIAFAGSIYGLYACYECGSQAVTYAALLVFIGWTLYGRLARNYTIFPKEKTSATTCPDEETAIPVLDDFAPTTALHVKLP